jgi:hypothetical protein
MAVTKEQLAAIGVDVEFGTPSELLPLLTMDIEELRMINDAVGAPSEAVGHIWDKGLSVSIGKGITYHLMCQKKYGVLDIYLSVAKDYFAFPVDVKIVGSHEPQEDSEHSDWCPYSQEWAKDSNGDEYWVDDNGEPDYDPECNCEYVIDSIWEGADCR